MIIHICNIYTVYFASLKTAWSYDQWVKIVIMISNLTVSISNFACRSKNIPIGIFFMFSYQNDFFIKMKWVITRVGTIFFALFFHHGRFCLCLTLVHPCLPYLWLTFKLKLNKMEKSWKTWPKIFWKSTHRAINQRRMSGCIFFFSITSMRSRCNIQLFTLFELFCSFMARKWLN